MPNRPATDPLESRARRRVKRKLGFYTHVFVFVLVNLGLVAINGLTGEPRWSVFPLLGWGLGLVVHAIVTLIGLHGDGLRDAMLRRELEQLKRAER